MRKVLEHSHHAADIDLIGQVNKMETAIGSISPAEMKIDLTQMKPKSSKNDAEVISQISYIDGLIDTVRFYLRI